jgi:hypothetical protein
MSGRPQQQRSELNGDVGKQASRQETDDLVLFRWTFF